MTTVAADLWSCLEALAREVVGGRAAAWGELCALLEPKARGLARSHPIGRLKDRPDDLRDIAVAVLEKLHKDDFRTLRAYFAAAERPSFAGWLRCVVRSSAIDHMRQHPEYRRLRPRAGAAAAEADDVAPRWFSLATLTTGQAVVDKTDSLVARRTRVLSDLREADRLARDIASAQRLEGYRRVADAEGLPLEEARAAVERGERRALRRFQDTVAESYGEVARRCRVGVLQARRLVGKGDLYEPVFAGILQGRTHQEIAAELAVSAREVELIVSYAEAFLRARYGTLAPEE